jgi:hypothetical protein
MDKGVICKSKSQYAGSAFLVPKPHGGALTGDQKGCSSNSRNHEIIILLSSNFFLWGYAKDVVYVPPLPNDPQELRQRIIAAVATINRDMLERVCTEMDYRIDVCRVTLGFHIECL